MSFGEAAPSRPGSVFLPLLLLSLAMLGWFGFQAYQLLTEREQIASARSNIEPQVQAATKLRASLDAVASGTAKLAAGGNPNARVIVDELRRRGITINPDAPAAAPPKAP